MHKLPPSFPKKNNTGSAPSATESASIVRHCCPRRSRSVRLSVLPVREWLPRCRGHSPGGRPLCCQRRFEEVIEYLLLHLLTPVIGTLSPSTAVQHSRPLLGGKAEVPNAG